MRPPLGETISSFDILSDGGAVQRGRIIGKAGLVEGGGNDRAGPGGGENVDGAGPACQPGVRRDVCEGMVAGSGLDSCKGFRGRCGL